MPLRGLYLEEAIHRERRRERAFIYTNFISSLDGRIAVGTDGSHPSGVPAALANARDWRLYQELTIQADVIITSGRYLREFASGDAGPVFTFDRDPDLADLREWRSTAGLAEEPALAVVSRQLDFDWKAARRQSPAVIGIGSSDADAAVVSRLENEGIAVVLGSSRSGVDRKRDRRRPCGTRAPHRILIGRAAYRPPVVRRQRSRSVIRHLRDHDPRRPIVRHPQRRRRPR